MQRIYSKDPVGLDACSEPCQIPKVEPFAITAYHGFKSLTVFAKSSTSNEGFRKDASSIAAKFHKNIKRPFKKRFFCIPSEVTNVAKLSEDSTLNGIVSSHLAVILAL